MWRVTMILLIFFDNDKLGIEESGLEPNSFADIEPDNFDISVNNTQKDNSSQGGSNVL